MRLDSLGKPPLVLVSESDRPGKMQAQNVKQAPVAPAAKSPEAGTSTTPDRGPRLGHIIDILEKAKKTKRALSKKEISEGIKKYQLMSSLSDENAEPEQKLGQTLDRVV